MVAQNDNNNNSSKNNKKDIENQYDDHSVRPLYLEPEPRGRA